MAYVLVVDDDEDYANSLAMAMRQDDHEVAIELDTEAAVVSMQERRPDLLILDVMFSEDMSAGFRLARAMRHVHADLKAVPILILTAINAQFPLGFNSRDIDDNWLPVSEFLEKPVDFDVLRGRAKVLLGDRAPAPGEGE